MKKLLCLLLLFSLLLTACAAEAPKWPEYSPDRETYVYCHSQERECLWEEDVVFFADSFLGTHPMLKEGSSPVYALLQLPDSPEVQQQYYDTDTLFDASARESFITGINTLIPAIAELSDSQIVYELQRLAAALKDAHTSMDVGFRDFFPISFDVIYSDGAPAFHAVQVPQGLESLLLGKLTAINGVPTETVIQRLAPYVSHENEYWLAYRLQDSMLTQRAALQQAGVVLPEETSAVFSLKTENGITDVTLEAMSPQAYDASLHVRHPMADAFAYAARDDRYWYELLNNNKCLYIRFSAMTEDPEYSFNSFLGDVKKVIRESKEPLQVIFDFRGNGGGMILAPQTQSLIAGLIPYPSHSTYVLIDSGSFSAGVSMPLRLSVGIPDARLAGSPAGQGANHFSNPVAIALPNHGYPFYIATRYQCNSDTSSGDALQPDISVWQTLEDYRNCNDTVLQYVLSLAE